MPSAVASKAAPPRPQAIDNYDPGELSDDPFRSSPEPEPKKRKEPDSGLGIDEEISVQKRARVPNVKLDENRLLSAAGIPTLRKRAQGLKLKSKGHEFSDAARLLSFYQLWLDDLFPKAKFRDALAMVEKAGHKKRLMVARNEWINEGKPKDNTGDMDDEFEADNSNNAPEGQQSERPADTASLSAPAPAPATPPRNNDVPDDDDIYDVTPGVARRNTTSRPAPVDAEPDDDDLEALMAEAAGEDMPSRPAPPPQQQQKQSSRDDEPDDDLDALMAEAETHDALPSRNKTTQDQTTEANFDDDEAAMQEMGGLW